jgi:Methylase involved in ubiquinone/menaquinone biosynthesis
MKNIKPIPESQSDRMLENWGYNLVDEYYQIITEAKINNNVKIFDIATGSGRAVAMLTRLGYSVLTGDYDISKRNEAETRITAEFLHKVEFVKVDISELPFESNQLESIVCLNTLHELDNPVKGLNELVRVISAKGKLLVADFNSEGFDVMDKLHTEKFGELHPRGNISIEEIKKILLEKFLTVNEINTRLNTAFVAQNKII